MTRLALRTSARAMKQVLRQARKVGKTPVVKAAATRKRAVAKRASGASARARPKAAPGLAAQWTSGVALGAGGARRYRLFKPTGVQRGERLPLVVMLHGCSQDAAAFAASTRMNRLAQTERFLVLYPEQDRLANLQNCWSWYDTRAGRAQREADSIASAVEQVCLTQPVNRNHIGLAGLSAGASLAALLAVRLPGRFRAVVMHSGVAPGMASSGATALGAMRARRTAVPLAALAEGSHLPALLVIQGQSDALVAAGNGAMAAQLWAQCEGARPGAARTVQRGKRYPAQVTDYRARGRLVATLCEVQRLGHAWSGGAASQSFSDPQGPDASRMAWAFMRKQFALPGG